jgi:predicted nucleotidyltransferase
MKADLDLSQHEILLSVQTQMKRKMGLKKGYRKKAKETFERLFRRCAHAVLSSDIRIKPYDSNSSLGCDELGRDVEDGVRKYVEILKSRGIEIETVIALGSRVKGSWKPQSDVDLTVIADNLPHEGRNSLSKRLNDMKIRLLLSDRPIYIGIEPSGCCSACEFLERLKRFDVQTLDAVLYGKVIYDTGFWRTAIERYRTLEKMYHLENIDLKAMVKCA